MLAVEPWGLLGGDEELGAVAAEELEDVPYGASLMYLRVGSGVGHGEDTGTGVLQLEVLIGETFTVDGLATGSLRVC